MQTLTSAPSLAPAYQKRNLREIQDNVVPPIGMRHEGAIFLRNIATTGVLLAFAPGGFAQTQQLAANVAAEQPDGEANNVAAVEKKPAARASDNADQPQSAAALSNEIANPLSNLWFCKRNRIRPS